MVKTGIPVPVFYTFFGLGIVFSIGLIIYMAKHQTHSSLTKNIVIWFALLMIINLVNLIFTFVYYEQKKTLIGQEGNKGRRGPRGFSGENMKCGNKLCGDFGKNDCNPDEKDKEGKCIYSGGTVDENGKDRSSKANIQIGMCKFPFVYNYKNQYGCINQEHPDYPKEGEDRLGLPKGGETEGLCATDLNPNNTARTWGFCTGNSMRAKEFSYTNRKGNENERLQEKQSGIVDLTIVHGDTDKEAKCPKGYRKIDGDLNKGAGAYVYMCAKDGMGNVGVTEIDVVEGNDNCSKVFPKSKKNELTRLTTNLNKDTDIGTSDPQELYMCIRKQKGSRDFITDIKVNENEKWSEGINTKYQKIKGDLNKDTGGSPVFIFTTTTNREINPLKSAFYIPDTRVLHFSMGNSGEDFYLYNEDEKKVGDKDRVANIMGVIPKNYEAIAYLNDNVYVFKGSLVYEVDFELKKIKVGYPKKIKTLFPQIPNNIDAAYINPNDTDAYFFKDKLVYRFKLIKSNAGDALGKLVERYPKNINQIFAGAPNYPDAVFTIPDEKEKNYTYIASATSFRVFDEDNILIRTDTIDLDTRFGLKTNSGFEITNIKNNATANATTNANTKETFTTNNNNEPEPEPWKGCKDKEFASMNEGTCPVDKGNRDARSGTSFGSNIGSSPLSPS